MEPTRWDLGDLYPDNKSFLSDLGKAKAMLRELQKFRGKLKRGDRALLKRYFDLDTEFSIISERLAVYARCKYDDDGKNETNIKNYQMIGDFFSELGQKLAFVSPELVSLDEELLSALSKEAEFADYNRTLEGIIREKKHSLSERDEALMASISAFSNPDEIYDSLSDIEMDHGKYTSPGGDEIQLTTGNLNSLMKTPVQAERKKIIETYLEKYKQLHQTLSGLYISNVKHTNFLARQYKFNSALEMSAYGEELGTDIMLKNIEVVSAHAPLLQRFFKLKKRILNLKEFYTSDINADIIGERATENIDFTTACKDIYNCFEVLGRDYQEQFLKTVEQGWIDAEPRDAKASGGYTISTYSVHPYILLNYDGTAYWKSAIAHEFGHAMHSYYSAKAQPYAKHDYTIFVAEIASLTNEILLELYLLKNCRDKKVEAQLLADFLQLFYLNVFNSSMLAEFELYAHNKLFEGKTISGGDLNKKYISICKKYFGDSVKFVKYFEYDWTRKSHFFRDYYLYKYSTGLVCACSIAKSLFEDRSGEYLKKYKEFLSLGDSLSPLESLKVAGIDIGSEKPYDAAFLMFKEFTDRLEKIYSESEL